MKTFLAKVLAGVLLLGPASLSGQTLPHDPSFDGLTWTERVDGQCSLSFPSGEIRTAQAFNETEREIAPVLLFSGRTKDRIRVGERLYAKSLDGLAYRALVIDAGDETATIAMSRRFLATLFHDDNDAIWLWETPDVRNIMTARMVTLDDSDHATFRTRLAQLFDCVDNLEIG